MNLNDLSARELARLDAICLDYEQRLRQGHDLSIDEIVADFGDPHAELLQRELTAVKEEVQQAGGQVAPPFGASTPDSTSLGSADNVATVVLGSDRWQMEGTQIGPYRVTGTLGHGGMGVVYDAVDTRLDRRVAIKMLYVTGVNRQELVDRFEYEAKAVAALTHPHIVELFDVGVADGIPYAVMEYLDGETLAQRLKHVPLTATEVRVLGLQIAEALAVAHENGVVHRDLKPENVMLLRSGRDLSVDDPDSDAWSNLVDKFRIKVFDFGLSSAPRDGRDDSQTKAGMIMGTPGYMSPEQLRGEQATASADIFSLGCVLYEAFYGRKTIEGRTLPDLMAATLNVNPVGDRSRRREDVQLADLIERCLAKEPLRRPSSTEICRLLRDAERAGPAAVGGEHGDPGVVVRRRFLISAGGGLCGALVGTWVSSNRTPALTEIRSIAVLSIKDESLVTGDRGMPDDGNPLADRPLDRGQRIAVLLVNELARLNDFVVPPFRPLEAELPSEFKELGQRLGVDALLTGKVRLTESDGKQQTELQLQLVSATAGNQLWGDTFVTEATDDLLQQSRLAGEIAANIGRELTATAEAASPPNSQSFHCLVDGKARSDPDSITGLQRALMCFEKASKFDTQFADPVAGIALTSITLAAQSGEDETIDHVQRARTEMERAIKLDPASIEARLARAMLNWQTRPRIQEALSELRELTRKDSSNWQVQHQYGLLQLALGDQDAAILALRDASRLNPHSVLVKLDHARAEWIAGRTELAVNDAIRYRDRYNGHPLARGLLVDIYEQQGDFASAAAQHESFPDSKSLSAESYFALRSESIAELNYGPFGDLMNQAILEARLGQVDDPRLGDLSDSLSPMFPLLLAAHPAFAAIRTTPRAEQLLPNSLISDARAIEAQHTSEATAG